MDEAAGVIVGLIAIVIVIALAIEFVGAAITGVLTLLAGIFIAISTVIENIANQFGLTSALAWFIVWAVIGVATAAIIAEYKIRRTIPPVPLTDVRSVVNRTRLTFICICAAALVFVVALPFLRHGAAVLAAENKRSEIEFMAQQQRLESHRLDSFVTKALNARGVGSDGRLIGVGTTFEGPRASVVAYFSYQNGRVGSDSVTLKLIGAQTAACREIRLRYQTGNVWCRFNNLWPGVYYAEFWLNGQLLKESEFSVTPN